MSPSTSSAEPQSWRAAWEAALDDLELTVAQTEDILRGEHPHPSSVTWTPPQLPCPLPADLAGRASQLLTRQQDLLARTARAAASARTAASLVDRVADTRSSASSPLYVDVRA